MNKENVTYEPSHPKKKKNARVLTCDDVQVSIFCFVVAMLWMFATVLVDNWLVLYQLVLFAETNVTISVELRNVTGKVLNMHDTSCFASDCDWCFKVDIWLWIRLVGIVQIVVVGVDAFTVKWLEKRFKSWTKHSSHDKTIKYSQFFYVFFFVSSKTIRIEKLMHRIITSSAQLKLRIIFFSRERTKRVLSLRNSKAHKIIWVRSINCSLFLFFLNNFIFFMKSQVLQMKTVTFVINVFFNFCIFSKSLITFFFLAALISGRSTASNTWRTRWKTGFCSQLTKIKER